MMPWLWLFAEEFVRQGEGLFGLEILVPMDGCEFVPRTGLLDRLFTWSRAAFGKMCSQVDDNYHGNCL